jgi:hypothetical protein
MGAYIYGSLLYISSLLNFASWRMIISADSVHHSSIGIFHFQTALLWWSYFSGLWLNRFIAGLEWDVSLQAVVAGKQMLKHTSDAAKTVAVTESNRMTAEASAAVRVVAVEVASRQFWAMVSWRLCCCSCHRHCRWLHSKRAELSLGAVAISGSMVVAVVVAMAELAVWQCAGGSGGGRQQLWRQKW